LPKVTALFSCSPKALHYYRCMRNTVCWVYRNNLPMMNLFVRNV
jgi:hypothetical protein